MGFLVKRTEVQSRLDKHRKLLDEVGKQISSMMVCPKKKTALTFDEADLPHTQSSLQAEHDEMLKKIVGWQQHAKSLKESSFAAFVLGVESGEQLMTAIAERTRKTKQAIDFLSSVLAKEQRSHYQSRRWRVVKLSQQLVGGKFEVEVAKKMSQYLNRIYDQNTTDNAVVTTAVGKLKAHIGTPWQEVDKMMPALWTSAAGMPTPEKFLQNSNTLAINNKTSELSDMLKENPKWGGVFRSDS